jgi:hypothetical protein
MTKGLLIPWHRRVDVAHDAAEDSASPLRARAHSGKRIVRLFGSLYERGQAVRIQDVSETCNVSFHRLTRGLGMFHECFHRVLEVHSRTAARGAWP